MEAVCRRPGITGFLDQKDADDGGRHRPGSSRRARATRISSASPTGGRAPMLLTNACESKKDRAARKDRARQTGDIRLSASNGRPDVERVKSMCPGFDQSIAKGTFCFSFARPEHRRL
jgi:hypothetical protein